MSVAKLTNAAAVMKAIAEYDEIGESKFLTKYGFRRSREYFVVYNSKRYASKALAAAAFGYQFPDSGPLANTFSGGDARVGTVFRRMDFIVERSSAPLPVISPHTNAPISAPTKRNPSWADVELILALDLYLQYGILDDRDPRVIELSELLNRLPAHASKANVALFRNANGVAMKLANFAALDPSYEGKGMSGGGRRDSEIWELYSEDEEALHEAAKRIRAGDVTLIRTTTDPRPTIAAIPIEALNVDRFGVEHVARMAAAERREQQLVINYKGFLERQGHHVVRHKYNLDGRSLYSDLFDVTNNLLCEAKGDVTRESLRMAVGQLLDYVRFYEPRPTLAVLIPRRPSNDMLRYLSSVMVAAIFLDTQRAWQHVEPSQLNTTLGVSSTPIKRADS